MKKAKVYDRKRCTYCGKWFTPTHARTKYCRPAHRLAEHRYQRALRDGTLFHFTFTQKRKVEGTNNEQT